MMPQQRYCNGAGVDGITQAWLKKNPLSGMSNLLGTHDRDTE